MSSWPRRQRFHGPRFRPSPALWPGCGFSGLQDADHNSTPRKAALRQTESRSGRQVGRAWHREAHSSPLLAEQQAPQGSTDRSGCHLQLLV